jgi:hypothetical protein
MPRPWYRKEEGNGFVPFLTAISGANVREKGNIIQMRKVLRQYVKKVKWGGMQPATSPFIGLCKKGTEVAYTLPGGRTLSSTTEILVGCLPMAAVVAFC